MNSKTLTARNSLSATILATVMLAMGGISMVVQNANAQLGNNMTGTMMGPQSGMMMMGGPGMMMTTPNRENITSSINLMNIISNAIGSQIKVSLSNATTTAETSVGNNSHAVAAHIGDENGYLVYTIFVLDPNMNFNTVIVDPGNGQVLSSKQISKEEHLMMHKGMMGPGMMGPGMMGPGMMG